MLLMKQYSFCCPSTFAQDISKFNVLLLHSLVSLKVGAWIRAIIAAHPTIFKIDLMVIVLKHAEILIISLLTNIFSLK